MARNVAFETRRRERRLRAREQRAARAEGVPGAVQIVERAQVRRLVVDAVLELGEPYRSTVLLRFSEDLPPRQIARRMGVPVETVRTRLKRALAQLRARLQREFGSDRESWSLALLPLAKLPSKPAAGGAALLGVLLMKAKVAIVVLSLAVAAVLIWHVLPGAEDRAGRKPDAASSEAVTPGTARSGRTTWLPWSFVN